MSNNVDALVYWPSAPLTNRLVRQALDTLKNPPNIVDRLTEKPTPKRDLLQWSTYDAINHDLTYKHSPDSKILSSSYVIRKALIRKHFLSRCLHSYCVKHPDSVLCQAVPRTWDLELSFADELDEMWGDELWDLGEELDKNDPLKWWILKPGMADRGMGIRLFHSKEDLTNIFEQFDEEGSEEEVDEDDDNHRNTAVVTSQLRHFVIQEYLSNPLLLDPTEVPLDASTKSSNKKASDLHGHKFHLRAYCVASGALSVYLYTRILSLFSAVPYTAPDASMDRNDSSQETHSEMDISAHLTNTSLQTERGEAGVRLFDELVGCQILSSESSSKSSSTRHQPTRGHALGQAIETDNPQSSISSTNILTEEDVKDIKDQMAEILAEVFNAGVDMSVHFQPLPNAFELFGIDFLVSHIPNPSTKRRFQVHILEVNSEPAIELTGPRLTWILEDLFKSIASDIVAPFFGVETKSEGESKDVNEGLLRKCLDVQIRANSGW
ncbi:putative tubulin-tyrosine ligase [Abortiporus biennis]